MNDKWKAFEDYEEQMARAVSDERQSSHVGHNSAKHYKEPNKMEQIGARGERAFARAFGLDFDYAAATQQVRGDGGVDFSIPMIGRPEPLTIDLKSTEHGFHLTVKAEDIDSGAEILVLVRMKFGYPTFLGWETRDIMRFMPIADLGSGERNYIRPAEVLRPMDQLLSVLAFRASPK